MNKSEKEFQLVATPVQNLRWQGFLWEHFVHIEVFVVRAGRVDLAYRVQRTITVNIEVIPWPIVPFAAALLACLAKEGRVQIFTLYQCGNGLVVSPGERLIEHFAELNKAR